MVRTVRSVAPEVRDALTKLGTDLGDARRARRIPTKVMADLIQVSRPTLRRLEAGDPVVGIGCYATALRVFGMVDRIAELADPGRDPVGRNAARAALPERIRSRR